METWYVLVSPFSAFTTILTIVVPLPRLIVPAPLTVALESIAVARILTEETEESTTRSYFSVSLLKVGVREYPSIVIPDSLLFGLPFTVGFAHAVSGMLLNTGILKTSACFFIASVYALASFAPSPAAPSTLVIYWCLYRLLPCTLNFFK